MIKFECTWTGEIKEQAPQLTLLYGGRTVRSSRRRCCIRKLFLKILQYPQETPMLDSIFQKVAELATLWKETPTQHRCFPVNIAKLIVVPILKNICKRLCFNFFKGSLLHGAKGLRSRLYDGVRLQGPSHRSSCRHLSSWSTSQPAFEDLRQILWLSQSSFYIVYFWSF